MNDSESRLDVRVDRPRKRSELGQTRAGQPPTYDFSNPLDVTSIPSRDFLLPALVATDAFQRLKSIRFLGGIDYLLVRTPNGRRGHVRYTRYQHSLGVARLSIRYSEAAGLRSNDRRLLSAAALLHDIGHAPLSHSLEPVFRELFDQDHHRATRDLICGQTSLGRELYSTLKKGNIDIDRLLALISAQEEGFHNFFHGPINFDTIEGILRSHSYTAHRRFLPTPETFMFAAFRREGERDKQFTDMFWSLKDETYRSLVNSQLGAMADIACQTWMRKHIGKINRGDYFLTEPALFEKLAGLREFLRSPRFGFEFFKKVDSEITWNMRSFFVDTAGDFFDRQDRVRYKQKKGTRKLRGSRSSVGRSIGRWRDLFKGETCS